jgi:hypothetical protein
MSRTEPLALEGAPAASQSLLAAVKKQIGRVQNIFRTLAHSPAALEGYLGLSNALSRGSLDAATRDRIALAVAERSTGATIGWLHTPTSARTSRSYPKAKSRPTAVANRWTLRRPPPCILPLAS